MILFRADGSKFVGLGHIMRCMTIADAFTKKGVECIFAMADDSVKNIVEKTKTMMSLNCIWIRNWLQKFRGDKMLDNHDVTELKDYIAVIKNFHEVEGCGSVRNIYYRGQSNVEYKLIPSLGHRIAGYEGETETYARFENEIIVRAKLEYPDIFREHQNKMDEIALMQHYGLPTRLMDVTENPLVALYFACDGNKGCDGEVFVFYSGLYAETYTSYAVDQDERDKKDKKLFFVRTKTFSNRQRAQQGLFMWVPDNKLEGIEKDSEINPIIADIIRIPSKDKERLLEELKMVGISPKSLFPDNLDKCCEVLLQDITKNAFSA